MEKKKKRILLLNIFTLILLGIFVVSAFKLGSIYFTSVKTEKEFKQQERKLKKDRKSFFKGNEDMVAWIRIPGTKVNYPVMYTPDKPEYYLRKNIKKKYSIAGTPFIGQYCNISSKSFIIYGHNMKIGTMFHSLVDYENKEFYNKHKYVYLDTKHERIKYKIFASLRTEVGYEGDEEKFPYYKYMGNISEEEFNKYISEVTAKRNYSTGVDVTCKDNILTLSTCAYHADNGRFVVVAKEISRKRVQ